MLRYQVSKQHINMDFLHSTEKNIETSLNSFSKKKHKTVTNTKKISVQYFKKKVFIALP